MDELLFMAQSKSAKTLYPCLKRKTYGIKLIEESMNYKAFSILTGDVNESSLSYLVSFNMRLMALTLVGVVQLNGRGH